MSVLRRRSTPQYGASWQGLPVDDAGSLGSASGGGYYDRLTDHRRPSGSASSLRLPVLLSPRARLLLGLLLALAPWAYHAAGAGRLRALQRELTDADLAQRQRQADLGKAKRDLERLAAARAAEEARSHDLLGQLHAAGDTVLDNSDTSDAAAVAGPDYRAQLAEEAPYLERIKEIESALARKLAGMATTKYGNGPFHVVVTLAAEPRPGVGRSFMIETVPTNAMPLSVGHFVRLVERGVFDGLALLHSHQSANVVQTTAAVGADGGPRPVADTDPELHRLAYAEHNPAYGIEKYSVAFAGKPGGPNFYVFMDQKYDPASHLGEACFGKVIHGERILDAIVDSTGQQKKLDMYSIESVRILPQEEN